MHLFSRLRAHQRAFFVACTVLGGVVATLPFLAEPNGNMAVVPYLTTWFMCGVAAGVLVPERPWRWAFAMALGQPIALVVREPEMSLLVLVMIPLIPIMAVPMIAGAYMGTLLSPVRTTTTPAAVIPSAQFPGVTSRLMMLSTGGLLIGAIPVSFVPRTSSALFILWIAVAAVLGVASVAWAGSGVWKATGITVGVAIAAFMTAVIYDTSMGGPNHNMLPFELWYVSIATFVSAASLAVVTRWIVGKSRVLPQEA
jgi:hypothetical protein